MSDEPGGGKANEREVWKDGKGGEESCACSKGTVQKGKGSVTCDAETRCFEEGLCTVETETDVSCSNGTRRDELDGCDQSGDRACQERALRRSGRIAVRPKVLHE